MAKAPIRPMTEPIWTTQPRQTKAHEKLVSITNSTHLFQLCFDQENISNQTTVALAKNKHLKQAVSRPSTVHVV